MRFTLLSFSLLALCFAPLRADIIFGNLAAYTNDDGQSGAGALINSATDNVYNAKGVGFTMGLGNYDITSLTLRLKNVNDNPGVDVPTVRIFTAKAGAPVNGSNAGQANTLVGSFTNPAFTAGTTAANYTFTPSAPITLTAGTRYLIVVQQLSPYSASTDVAFNWMNGGNPSTVTPTGNGSNPTAVFGGDIDPRLWAFASSQYNYFQIDGTLASIPEPSTYAALVGVAALALTLARRSRRRPTL